MHYSHTLYSDADTCSLRGGFGCQDYSAWKKRRRRRGGELSPQLMSPSRFKVEAEGGREQEGQGARRVDLCLPLS